MSFNRKDQRAKRHLRLRQRVIGSVERPRMSICVTNKHMYVQFIDDAAGNTQVHGPRGGHRRERRRERPLDQRQTCQGG